LKLLCCPFCRAIGCLVLHGFLRGYEEDSQQKVVRAQRIWCSPRRQRGKKGCARTFAVYLAEFIPRLRIGTRSLCRFLCAVAGGTARIAAFRAVVPNSFHDSSIHRWWHRFANLRQSAIRSALYSLCQVPAALTATPAIQTILHLRAAFPSSWCPVAAFQLHFQRSFI
jgi:hypothetical protein